ncbi:MAG: phytanoyl-CoA dioxygenase family protein [Gammaproteobacteria bacterium]|nr:phytanoyl-CoA dioxygenase family protein [Gammaproteobacteria bacterium]
MTGKAQTKQTQPDYWSIDEAEQHVFQPIVNRSPKTLTESQISYFNENGFIEKLHLFDSMEANEHRRKFDSLLAEFQRRSRDAYSINGYQTRIDFIWDIATNPLLLDYVEDLLGPNIVLWGSHYFCKSPSDLREVPFHQDATYWPFRPFKTVTVWLAVDDVSRNMGPMCFMPGSHRDGKLAWRQRNENVVLGLEVEDYTRYGKPQPLLLKAGEFSLHADLLVHGSKPNKSDKRRCGLTLRYVPPDVRLIDERYANWIKNAIICRGEDTSGYWPKQTRPPAALID